MTFSNILLNKLPDSLQEKAPSLSTRDLLATLSAEQTRRMTENRLAYYQAWPKQAAFHDAGAIHRERLFMAGNRCGKTECGAAEMAVTASVPFIE